MVSRHWWQNWDGESNWTASVLHRFESGVFTKMKEKSVRCGVFEEDFKDECYEPGYESECE